MKWRFERESGTDSTKFERLRPGGEYGTINGEDNAGRVNNVTDGFVNRNAPSDLISVCISIKSFRACLEPSHNANNCRIVTAGESNGKMKKKKRKADI